MPNPRPVIVHAAAAVSVDDVRAAYYSQAPQHVWIREFHTKPLRLIVSDDKAGTVARVDVTIGDDGQIAFSAPVPVRVEYVEAAAAADDGRMVYACRAESRPDITLVAANNNDDDDDNGDEDDPAVDELVWALEQIAARLRGVEARKWNPDAHPRWPKGTPGGRGGQFRSRLLDSIQNWVDGDRSSNPLDGFSREQLRRAARRRGVQLRRGASREEIAEALLDSVLPEGTPRPGTRDRDRGPDMPGSRDRDGGGGDRDGGGTRATPTVDEPTQTRQVLQELKDAGDRAGDVYEPEVNRRATIDIRSELALPSLEAAQQWADSSDPDRRARGQAAVEAIEAARAAGRVRQEREITQQRLNAADQILNRADLHPGVEARVRRVRDRQAQRVDELDATLATAEDRLNRARSQWERVAPPRQPAQVRTLDSYATRRDVADEHDQLSQDEFLSLPRDRQEVILAELEQIVQARDTYRRMLSNHYHTASRALDRFRRPYQPLQDDSPRDRARRARLATSYEEADSAISGATRAEMREIASANRWGRMPDRWKVDQMRRYLIDQALEHDRKRRELLGLPPRDGLLQAAAVTVSDRPWSQFSDADYTLTQLRRASLIVAGPTKQDMRLPVREPDGTLNRHAVHSAAGRIHQVEGVPREAVVRAARALVQIYRRDLGEEPPQRLLELARTTTTTAAAAAAAGRPAAEPAHIRNKEEGDMSLGTEVRERLGLAVTADGPAVLAALDKLLDQAAGSVAASAQEKEAEQLRQEVKLLRGQVEDLSGQVAAAAAEKAAAAKQALLDAAQSAGKFKPADREQWERDYDAAPEVVERVLASIAPGTAVPVNVVGTTGRPVEAAAAGDDDDVEPEPWWLDGPDEPTTAVKEG